MAPLLAALLVLTGTCAGAHAAPCDSPSLLPAYAHNDYRNQRPLLDALELGFRGVEVDLFREGDALLVGHERDELDPARTLERLYLSPLRERLLQCGYILNDSTSFLFNIELKERDEDGFDRVLEAIDEYTDLFTSPTQGASPPARAVLVGWRPAPRPDIRLAQMLGAQLIVGRNDPPPTDLPVGLITIDGRSLRLTGPGRAPARRAAVVEEAKRLAAQYNAPIRVHHAPENRRVYQWLLSEGITFIGATNLEKTRALLLTGATRGFTGSTEAPSIESSP